MILAKVANTPDNGKGRTEIWVTTSHSCHKTLFSDCEFHIPEEAEGSGIRWREPVYLPGHKTGRRKKKTTMITSLAVARRLLAGGGRQQELLYDGDDTQNDLNQGVA